MHYNCRKIYYVTFEAHKDCTIYQYIFHCWAYDAKEAKETAKEAWTKNHKAHQFHLYAHWSKAPIVECLKVVSWKGHTFIREECIDKFICTDLRTWRVNGVNKYGPRAGENFRH